MATVHPNNAHAILDTMQSRDQYVSNAVIFTHTSSQLAAMHQATCGVVLESRPCTNVQRCNVCKTACVVRTTHLYCRNSGSSIISRSSTPSVANLRRVRPCVCEGGCRAKGKREQLSLKLVMDMCLWNTL